MVNAEPKAEKAAAIILDHLKMPEENFRLGKTKVPKNKQTKLKVQLRIKIPKISLLHANQMFNKFLPQTNLF